MGNEKTPKNAELFYCEFCDFKCCKQSDWNRHSMRAKHKYYENDNKNGNNGNEIFSKNATPNYICDCGKTYKHSSGLSRHKNANNCLSIQTNNYSREHVTEVKILTNLVLEVVKQNQELINQHNETQKYNQQLTNKIVEFSKNCISNTNITNSTNNSHNKTFNLQFFLNETCKNAMNIMDFVDSIKLQLTDLENVGKLGYVEGISNIITSNLNALDITQRPIHCADKKREVIYIKDEDKWEKEDEHKNKIKKVIHRVACKNQRLIAKFKEEHPDCLKASSKFSDQYNKIIVESMGGSGNNDREKEEKIIRNISKNIIIEKD
jgi:hypothetical protein